jgi:hypothetical protein
MGLVWLVNSWEVELAEMTDMFSGGPCLSG